MRLFDRYVAKSGSGCHELMIIIFSTRHPFLGGWRSAHKVPLRAESIEVSGRNGAISLRERRESCYHPFAHFAQAAEVLQVDHQCKSVGKLHHRLLQISKITTKCLSIMSSNTEGYCSYSIPERGIDESVSVALAQK